MPIFTERVRVHRRRTCRDSAWYLTKSGWLCQRIPLWFKLSSQLFQEYYGANGVAVFLSCVAVLFQCSNTFRALRRSVKQIGGFRLTRRPHLLLTSSFHVNRGFHQPHGLLSMLRHFEPKGRAGATDEQLAWAFAKSVRFMFGQLRWKGRGAEHKIDRCRLFFQRIWRACAVGLIPKEGRRY